MDGPWAGESCNGQFHQEKGFVVSPQVDEKGFNNQGSFFYGVLYLATLLILAFPPGMEKNPRNKISLIIARGTPRIVVLGALSLPRMLSCPLLPLHGKTLLVKQKRANCDVLLDKDVFSVAIYQGFDLALILSWIVVVDIINTPHFSLLHKAHIRMQHIANVASNKKLVMHVPTRNVINRGSHVGNKLAMQEFMI
ncbi:hypothetical protein SUGI_1128860 [Cryptomeria japonica]|nr:hypothetical protein SUGI_1128860 [Cryptomeria japonica]